MITNQGHMKEMTQSQIGSLFSSMEADREDLKEMMEEMMNLNLKEMRDEIKSGEAGMRSMVNAWIANLREDRKETMSCQVTTEAFLDSKELNPEEIESESKRWEVPTEDAVVKPAKGRKKRHRDRYQAAGRRGEPKELTRGNCGYRRKLAGACRKVSRRATVAWRKRNVFRNIRTPGKLWTAEGIGRSRQEDDPQYKGGTAQGTRVSGTQ
jgi:hypothetical protein